MYDSETMNSKATRFGEYENKTEAFINQISLQKKDKDALDEKQRKELKKQFEIGNFQIDKLNKKLNFPDSFAMDA